MSDLAVAEWEFFLLGLGLGVFLTAVYYEFVIKNSRDSG